MLVGQAKVEATRHEQKRAQAADKLAAGNKRGEGKDTADASAQLVTLTRRAVLMESQVEVLEGKRKALARHRDAIAEIAEAVAAGVAGLPGSTAEDEAGPGGSSAPTASVLGAQEELRREIARAMHDGPAQSLTNIVLQAQIVERLMERDATRARTELGLLVGMVQQTLDATKNFIFDVRPMVLDDLGLVPTLRRAARDRGRRAHVAVEFESIGQDRRLPEAVETGVFRILDEVLGAYLAMGPDRMTMRLDWTDELEARVLATRAAVLPAEDEPLPEVPKGDVPAAIKQMIQDRHDARAAAIRDAETAAVMVLPPAIRREIGDRAATIGASLEVLAGGGEVRLVVTLGTANAEGATAEG